MACKGALIVFKVSNVWEGGKGRGRGGGGWKSLFHTFVRSSAASSTALAFDVFSRSVHFLFLKRLGFS